jgi:hypothetical protein
VDREKCTSTLQSSSVRTYRTNHQAVGGALAALLFGGAAIGMMIEARYLSSFVFAAVFFVGIVWFGTKVALARLDSDEAGIRIMNVNRSFNFSWDEIARFDVGQPGLFPAVLRIHLQNGEIKRAFGLQEKTSFANGSAEEVAEELNAELARRRPGHLGIVSFRDE